MEEVPDLKKQRLQELGELFAPATEVYGEERVVGLSEDEALCAQIRESFERSRSAGRFPNLSEYLANLSDREKDMFFRTGGVESVLTRHKLVPEDLGLRFRRLQELLRRQPEFETRFPEAFEMLFPDKAKSADRIGMPLPSFGVTVLLNEPEAWSVPQDQYRGGDAHSHTKHPEAYQGSMPVQRDVWPVYSGHLRGVLLAILGREEYQERVRKFAWDEELMHGVKAPEESPVRLTDLRLAASLRPEALKRGLEQALSSLQKPVSAERVASWKFQTLGSKLGDPSASHVEMLKRMEEVREEHLSEGTLDLLKRLAEQAHQTPEEPFEAVPAKTELLKRSFGGEAEGTKAVSFAAAALLLFLDLDAPGLSDGSPRKLAERVIDLAEIVRELARQLDRATSRLDRLTAERKRGGRSRPLYENYRALRSYRMGTSFKQIAIGLGIKPYISKTYTGTTDWRSKVEQAINKGQEVEKALYPRAAAIFANKDNPHVRRKACRAYRAYLEELGRNAGVCSYRDLGRRIRTGTPLKERGREITDAYLQLGSCIMQGIPPLS